MCGREEKTSCAALMELDISESREKIKKLKQKSDTVSFTARLIKVISLTIKKYEQAAIYLKGSWKRTERSQNPCSPDH